jgi:hypothetical protein
LVAIQEGVRQEAHQAVHPGGIFLLPLVTMLLDLGVLGQGVETVQFGLIGFGGQRLVVDGDEAGDVALLGFEDVFRSVAMVVGSAEKIAEGAVSLCGMCSLGWQPGRAERNSRRLPRARAG